MLLSQAVRENDMVVESKYARLSYTPAGFFVLSSDWKTVLYRGEDEASAVAALLTTPESQARMLAAGLARPLEMK